MKKFETVLKECVTKVSDENLEFLHVRFDQRMAGDLAECLDLLSKISDIDKWLSGAQSCNQFFEMVDQIADQVEKEHNKRMGVKKVSKEKETAVS